MAWAIEMLAWVALIDERFDIPSRAARAGQDLTRMGTSAMVQLLAQEAKVWSQLGILADAEPALAEYHPALIASIDGLPGGMIMLNITVPVVSRGRARSAVSRSGRRTAFPFPCAHLVRARSSMPVNYSKAQI